MRITETNLRNESFSLAAAKPASLAASGEGTTRSAAFPSTSSAISTTLADDSADFSEGANLVSYTMALPESNAGKVSEVQMALAGGRFQMDTSRVASALMQTMLDGAWN